MLDVIPVADIGDVLSSPVWTVLATVLAAAAIAVTVVLYRRQRSRKSLAYEIKVTQLVNIHSEAKDKIQIYFAGEEIEQVHLVEVRLENTGNVPILKTDFEQPLAIELGTGSKALSLDASYKTPPELAAQLTVHDESIELAPLLLNPGDGLTLKLLVRNLTDEPQCHARIVGISQLVDRKAAQAQRQGQRHFLREFFNEGFLTVALAAVIISLIGSYFFGGSDKKDNSTVTLRRGFAVCGKVLSAGSEKIVIQLSDSNKIRSLPTGSVKSILDNSC